VTAFGASAKMQPPSAQSQAFDTTCSAWLGRWVDTIPLGFHRLLSDLRLLQLLRDTKRMRGTLPFVMTNLRIGPGLGTIIRFIEEKGALVEAALFPASEAYLLDRPFRMPVVVQLIRHHANARARLATNLPGAVPIRAVRSHPR